jgi:hypothetical protein
MRAGAIRVECPRCGWRTVRAKVLTPFPTVVPAWSSVKGQLGWAAHAVLRSSEWPGVGCLAFGSRVVGYFPLGWAVGLRRELRQRLTVLTERMLAVAFVVMLAEACTHLWGPPWLSKLDLPLGEGGVLFSVSERQGLRGGPLPSVGAGVPGWSCAGWLTRCIVVGSPSPVPCVESARGGVAGGTAGECACPAWGEWCGSPAPCAGGLHNIALQCIPPDSPAHWGGFRTADGSRPVCPGGVLWCCTPSCARRGRWWVAWFSLKTIPLGSLGVQGGPWRVSCCARSHCF